jgi:hypothetical protein
MGSKNSILPFLYPCELARSKFRHVLQRCNLSTLSHGTCWGVPAPNPVGKICSLASGKGREKTSVFPPAPQGRLCRNLSAPTLARAWGTAIPIKVVVRQNLRMSYWQPRRNLLFASINISFTTEHKKISE